MVVYQRHSVTLRKTKQCVVRSNWKGTAMKQNVALLHYMEDNLTATYSNKFISVLDLFVTVGNDLISSSAYHVLQRIVLDIKQIVLKIQNRIIQWKGNI